MEKEKNNLTFAFIGIKSCGKTSFINKLTEDKFKEEIPGTIGVTFSQFHLKEEKYDYKFIDTSGDEKYFIWAKNYFKEIDAAILFYDITQVNSFEFLENVMKDIENKMFFLIGTKSDLEEKRIIPIEKAEEFCKMKNINFKGEISSKTMEQVELQNLIIKQISLDVESEKLLKEKEKKNDIECNNNCCILF